MINEEQLNIEKNHLSDVYRQICEDINETKLRIEQAESALREHFAYKDDSIYDMDVEEEASTDLYFDNLQLAVDVLKKRLMLLEILKKSCYFGSFKFTSDNGFHNIYVGKSGFVGKNSYPLVCDWRAPISSMYYNYELGKASYNCEEGEVEGEILAKRQYKVKENEIIYAFDSSLIVSDEILKHELASAKSDKMQDIVATIQKEQNVIIREPNLKNMLIQGVAGSGKTSIALHRAAFLLYSMRKELNSENILVVSHSDLFSKYIENVLPELGEDSINSMTFIDFAHEQLDGFCYETSQEMSERLLQDESALSDYLYKNSFEFVADINNFLQDYDKAHFIPTDIKLGEDSFSADDILLLYNDKFKNLMPAERLLNICDYICDVLNIPSQAKLRVLNNLYSMYTFGNIFDILIEFYKNNEKINKKLEKNYKNSKILINYDDLIAILYLANHYYGLEKKNEVKLLIVDEFQEYAPLHFELLRQICPCNWIVLGDINQSIFKNLDEKYLLKLSVNFDLGDVIYLTKSYRMTNQIAEMANKIKDVGGTNFDRNGEKVDFIKVNEIAENLNASRFETKAVLCKDEKSASEIYNILKHKIDCSLNKFEHGKVLVASVNNVKGIEFEQVVVYNFGKFDTNEKLDKNILYNIITRATNKLVIATNE